MEYVKTLTVNSGSHEGHIQGIAVDTKREYMYISATTRLLKVDMSGTIVGSVKGLAGHLGCIAYNEQDGRVYGSLEFKHDIIGRDILAQIDGEREVEDGFYMARFNVDKIDRPDMDAEQDGVMDAVYLKEVYDDYTAPVHHGRYSGIDGVTFAPAFGSEQQKRYLYVAYGVYNNVDRTDNDHQVILQYDFVDWDQYAKPLDQADMHRSGPAQPQAKYYVYTGNTEYGIQNLEYDPFTDTVFAAVYPGFKPQFPNYPLFFLDRTRAPRTQLLVGLGREGDCLSLAAFGELHQPTGVRGSRFPHGSTGICSLGDGYFYVSQAFRTEEGYGTTINLYAFDKLTATFTRV